MKRAQRGDIVHTIIATITEAEGVSIDSLPPVGETIDIEALEQVIESSRGDLLAEFTYHGWTITVSADETIAMSEPASEHAPYVSRCTTCSEETHGVTLEAAQDFFAEHAEERHEVEIVRGGDGAPDQAGDVDESRPTSATGTD